MFHSGNRGAHINTTVQYLIHQILSGIRQQLDVVPGTLLWWFIHCHHRRLDAQWDVQVWLIPAVQEPQALVACHPPIVEEALHQVRVFKHDIIHVTVGLAVEGDG